MRLVPTTPWAILQRRTSTELTFSMLLSPVFFQAAAVLQLRSPHTNVHLSQRVRLLISHVPESQPPLPEYYNLTEDYLHCPQLPISDLECDLSSFNRWAMDEMVDKMAGIRRSCKVDDELNGDDGCSKSDGHGFCHVRTMRC
jgi:hypothetical protein